MPIPTEEDGKEGEKQDKHKQQKQPSNNHNEALPRVNKPKVQPIEINL